MLVLTRKPLEKVRIGRDIEVVALGVDPRTGTVRLGFQAPKSVPVWREELISRGETTNDTEAGDDDSATS